MVRQLVIPGDSLLNCEARDAQAEEPLRPPAIRGPRGPVELRCDATHVAIRGGRAGPQKAEWASL